MLGTVTKNENETRQTLASIRAAGYDSLELNGFMIRPTSFLVRAMTKAAGMPVGKGGNYDWKGLLQEAGLTVSGVHEDLGSIKRDPAGIAKEAQDFGTDFVIITGMYRFDYSDEEALSSLASDLNQYGRELKAHGVHLLYHNHNCELRKVGNKRQGITAYEYLIDHTDPEAVNFEFDSYWFTEGGADAASWMRKLGSRLKLWHINDRGTRLTGPSMTPILKSDSMELGFGNMPLDTLSAIAKEAGIEAVVLESHKNWVDKDPVKSLTLSAEYLKRTLG